MANKVYMENYKSGLPIKLARGYFSKLGITLSGSANFDMSGSTGTFKTPTGAATLNGATTISSTSANALAVGANGATNPVLKIDASTASVATGVSITGAAAAGGVAVAVVSSGTNENLTIDAKGSGSVTINGTATGGITLSRAVTAASSVLSTSASAGIGYATGAGAAVTQITSRTTGVTINAVSGAITLVSAAGSATFATFTVTNSAVAATDTVLAVQKSGTDLYHVNVTAVAAGSFNISFATTGGVTVEQPVFNFVVIKAVAA